jgi:protein-S-isoprenylcysteine O-methyltransferase Ste14
MNKIVQKYIHWLVGVGQKERSNFQMIVSLTIGSIFFIVILPSVFVLIGRQFSNIFFINWHNSLEVIIASISIILGLFFLVWATYTQITIGKGTPAPIVSTKKLVIKGPYKLCRNPIQLGAMLYYLGIGTIFASLSAGIICLLLALLVGTLYHRFVEEKELEARFGDEYKLYRKSTPFLVPAFWKRK